MSQVDKILRAFVKTIKKLENEEIYQRGLSHTFKDKAKVFMEEASAAEQEADRAERIKKKLEEVIR